ncbi:hypothetical protein GMLC_36840 [Geomonas limicola]|uniref:Uncharacterized protein n=1 Tax=Geomonas limicola TaxID=2740186 RepID=A0A6V8NBV5_9BACT|nr:hypothetical protein [Geomonas limicola]GFO70105.1 hypothetical protein GMLC_36840 [Geomonas limicola]
MPQPTKLSLTACLSLVVLFVLALYGLNAYGVSTRHAGPAGSIGRARAVTHLLQNPTDAYALWKEAGYRGRTVVFVSGNWPSFVPGERLPEQMYRAYPLELFNTAQVFEKDSLDRLSFLYVAALNGIARSIVAVLPEEEFARQRQAALKAKDHRILDGEVYFPREGYPRRFSTAARLRAPGEPVLLYVGASYFSAATADELYRQLSTAGLRSDCVVLCAETESQGLGPRAAAELNRFARLIGATPGGGAPAVAGTGSRSTP